MSQLLWATPEVVMIDPESRYDPSQKLLWAIQEVVMRDYKSCYEPYLICLLVIGVGNGKWK